MEVRILEKVGILENWKILWLWRKEGNKEKGKRKRNYKREDIFFDLKNENIGNTDSRV